MAALLATDPAYLAKHKLKPDNLAVIITFSGYLRLPQNPLIAR